MALTMKLYNISTLLLSTYFIYSLYSKEKQFFVISLYLVKSKFHLCVVLNFILMLIINIGNFFVHIFFGDISLRDLMEITEKIRVKLITFLLFFLTFRPQIDISNILLIFLFFCISFVTWLTFKRSSFLIATRASTFFQHVKIIYLYCFVGIVNYLMYTSIYLLVEKSLKTSKRKSFDIVVDSMDFLIYYLLSLEVFIPLKKFLTLLLKLLSKMIKYIIELTQIYVGKVWDLKSISFAIISFIHYSVKLYVEITFCIVLVQNSVVPLFFIVDVIHSCYYLLKMISKFNDTIKVYSILKKLPDLVSKTTEEGGNKEEEKICNICLSPIEVGKMLHCGHIFHLSCLKDWIQVNSTCPLCKESILTEKKTRSESFNANLIQANEKDYEMRGVSANPTTVQMHNLKKIVEIHNLINKSQKTNIQETGAISYSLPCAALTNRSFENELLRLEVEAYNNRILELYEKPLQVLSRFHIDEKGEISLLK